MLLHLDVPTQLCAYPLFHVLIVARIEARQETNVDGKPSYVEIRLKSLGYLIARCWDEAEGKTSKSVAMKYFGPTEEQITFLFASELRASIEQASSRGEIGRAFVKDLRDSVSPLEYAAQRTLQTLIARVNFHNRRHEGKRSASDFGIVITKPCVIFDSFRQVVEFRTDRATGLLAQAKLGISADRMGGFKWSRFSSPQKRLFPAVSDYYSLLLFRLDGRRKDQLRRFGWQLCKGYSLSEIKNCLLSDRFPLEISSSDLLIRLFARRIGTENADVIRQIIDPKSEVYSPAIELKIFWPDRTAPPPPLSIQQTTRQAQQLRQRR